MRTFRKTLELNLSERTDLLPDPKEVCPDYIERVMKKADSVRCVIDGRQRTDVELCNSDESLPNVTDANLGYLWTMAKRHKDVHFSIENNKVVILAVS